MPPMDPHGATSTPTLQTVPCTLRELLLYFLRLGALGFGGPIALAGYMQRDLVERRRWISRQVIAPSLAMVLGLSVLYVAYGGLPWMQGVFYGIGAAVIAVIARSAFKLVRMTLARDFLLWGTFLVSAVVTAWTEQEVLWIFLASGVAVMLVRTPFPRAGRAAILVPPVLLAGLGAPATLPVLLKILWFFTIAGSVVFGSGLAIVPFLHGGVVNDFHWLDERQFLDAVAVAMITPGPVVITVAFIGYLVAGLAGAFVAALGVFLPCYLFVIIPAPYYRRWARVPQVKSFVDGVTAAATGAIAGAAYVLGRRAVIDLPTLAIFAVTMLALIKLRKVPEPVVILAAGAAGLFLRGLGGIPA